MWFITFSAVVFGSEFSSMGNIIHHDFIFFSRDCCISSSVLLSNDGSIQYLSRKYTIPAAFAISKNGHLN
jgi:hypothetical protein